MFLHCPGQADAGRKDKLPAFVQLARNTSPSRLAGERSQSGIENAAAEMPAVGLLVERLGASDLSP